MDQLVGCFTDSVKLFVRAIITGPLRLMCMQMLGQVEQISNNV